MNPEGNSQGPETKKQLSVGGTKAMWLAQEYPGTEHRLHNGGGILMSTGKEDVVLGSEKRWEAGTKTPG